MTFNVIVIVTIQLQLQLQMDNYIVLCETVANELGKGWSECIYQECLCVLLRENSVMYTKEHTLSKMFFGCSVGFIRADITLDSVVIECKAINDLQETHFPQILTYMEILNYTSGLFVNFVQNPSKPLLQIQKVTKISETEYLFDDHYNNTSIFLTNKGVKIEKDTSNQEIEWIQSNIIPCNSSFLYKKECTTFYEKQFKTKKSDNFIELIETKCKDSFKDRQIDCIKYKSCIINYTIKK